MLSLLALAMQIAAPPPAILSVRVGDRSAVVPIVQPFQALSGAYKPFRISSIASSTPPSAAKSA